MAALGDRLVGRYELLEVIGSGGMAIVWRAFDLRLGRTVAVKTLRPQFAEDAEFVARFDSEAHHAASLGHPNIAAVFDVGFDPDVDGGTRFIVMELVAGPSVADLLQNGPLPVRLALDIAIAAARALAAAHRRGIVHRDVKPANLLVGRDGRVRLADFGIARALASGRLTTAGILLGSAPYMSPEQARGEEAFRPSDLYSLGVVLFEMLHGRLPGRPETSPSTVGPAAGEDRDRPPEPGLPAGLDAILARALQPDPARRYPSARGFADALETAARRLDRIEIERRSNLAPTAHRSGPADALRRKRQRRPALASPSAAGAPASLEVTKRLDPASSPTTRHRPAVGSARRGGRRRRSSLALVAGLATILTSLFIVAAVVAVGARSLGEVLGTTATPPLSGGAASSPSPARGGGTGVGPNAGSPSLGPSPSPSIAPSHPPSPRPTPAPTAAPTRHPATQRPTTVAPTGQPTSAVADFYQAVASHDWDRAIARWSDRMRRRYPPDEWLIGRFSRTTRIDIIRLRQIALDSEAGRGTVAVTLVEYRSVEPSRRTFTGTWELVRVGGRWLLDEPHF